MSVTMVEFPMEPKRNILGTAVFCSFFECYSHYNTYPSLLVSQQSLLQIELVKTTTFLAQRRSTVEQLFSTTFLFGDVIGF